VAEATALLAIKDHPDVIDRLQARIEAEAKVAAARKALEGEGLAVIEEWTRLAAAGSAQARTACALLGIEPAEGTYGPDHRAALERHASASTANRDRTALALALAATRNPCASEPPVA